ncbi:MAG: N-acyl amino acid synthase FeeM domain-containing protein [Betaproteobacteria bacterium]
MRNNIAAMSLQYSIALQKQGRVIHPISKVHFVRKAQSYAHRHLRGVLYKLPAILSAPLYRRMVRCDDSPPANLTLKLAETQEELEACFKLLHQAYVRAGLMEPHPSGLRATVYHALPTTSTLLARYNDEVVGTLSLIRQSKLGFPLQKIFQIDAIQQLGGNIAEVSALAVAPRFQARGGMILFPLLKFMYEYATRYFATRHLVIAVNPKHIGFYESVLFFHRLQKRTVEHYDFVNGAPAVGAHLDLKAAEVTLKRVYNGLDQSRNLYRYFTGFELPNIHFPTKRFYTTTDPVMTPALLDYFFNQRTQLFANLPTRELRTLHAIYDLPAYRQCLPPMPDDSITGKERRRHRRFSISCPGQAIFQNGKPGKPIPLTVLECSNAWVRAEIHKPLALNSTCRLDIHLGTHEETSLQTCVTRRATTQKDVYVFRIDDADVAWQKFVAALYNAATHEDLEHATQFMKN